MCSGLLAIFSQRKETEVIPTDYRTKRQSCCVPHHHRERMDWDWIFFCFFLFTLSLRIRRILSKKLKGDRRNMKPQDCNHFSRNYGKERGLKLFCGCNSTKPALMYNAQAKTQHSNFPSSSPSQQQ